MTESLKPSPYDQENKGLAQPGNFDPGAGDGTSPQLANRRPLAIDLFSGLGGWAEGLDAQGYDVIRVDIEDMFLATGTPKPIPCLLMLQDVMTIHGSQFKHADLIVASPPCQEYSYMAMPWSLAKAKAVAIRADETGEAHKRLTALFDACFRIQREAIEAAGHHIPMVIENVRGAQPWVGRAAWNYGSFYLWGDVPALMPAIVRATKVPGFRFDGNGGSFQTASVNAHIKNDGGSWFNIGGPGQKVVAQNPDGRLVHVRNGAPHTKHLTNAAEHAEEGKKLGGDWFNGYAPGVQGPRNHGSGSTARKAASAKIAKIPFALSSHIARVYLPQRQAA